MVAYAVSKFDEEAGSRAMPAEDAGRQYYEISLYFRGKCCHLVYKKAQIEQYSSFLGAYGSW
jgi:hypothetical protein